MPRAPRSPKKLRPPATWLVCFEVDEPDEHLHVVSFQMLVRASEIDDALDQSKARIRQLRADGDLFHEPCTVYLVHALRLPQEPPRPILVNYSDSIVYEPTDDMAASITCGCPNQGDVDVEVYGVEGKKSAPVEPFLDFGGQRFRATLSKALERGKRGARPATWAEAPPPPPPPPRRRGGRGP